MFYEKIKTKRDLSHILICSLRILYNSKFVLIATSLGTNAVVVTRVHCTTFMKSTELFYPIEGTLANSKNTDQTTKNAAYDQDRHYLQ